MNGRAHSTLGGSPGQLERELAYYQRECNDLGSRLIRLQEEQSQAFREARDFLAQLKLKAGLAADFWHADLKLSRYGVRKWKET